MNYEEWLTKIDLLKNKDDLNVLKEIENIPYNDNIHSLLFPKLEELIEGKLVKAINNIIKNLDFMYHDQNYMDICMIEFKKNVEFLERLIKIQQLNSEEQNKLYKKLKEDVEKTYVILENESIKIDDKGILQMIIRNNRIKWSDNNEL